MHITSEIEILAFERETFRTPQPKVHISNFILKFPVDCDVMMLVLKDFIIQKLSEQMQAYLKANYSRRNFL